MATDNNDSEKILKKAKSIIVKDFLRQYREAVNERNQLQTKVDKATEFFKKAEEMKKPRGMLPMNGPSMADVNNINLMERQVLESLQKDEGLKQENIDRLDKIIDAGDKFVGKYRQAQFNKTIQGIGNTFKQTILDPITKAVQVASEKKAAEEAAKEEEEAIANGDLVEYTYKPGDTFGQVILDLGLNTDAGLWGDDGDVEFYAKQLDDQLNKSGVWKGVRDNIPIGTTIKLRRRGTEKETE